jgi:putative oxidoreductase
VHLPGGDWFGDMELPVLYLVAFIVIFLLGPGKYSVDSE